MNIEEKEITYTTTNSYSTLNQLSTKTENVWIVFHGIGYLSRYFIRLFDGLEPDKNYIIAPQAPSKYYKGNDYKRVGASWLTKENTAIETENILRYMDTIYQNIHFSKNVKLIVLGYSQGVSIATRWVAKRKIQCQSLVLISGGFPKELVKEDFDHLPETTKAVHIFGEKDPFYDIKKIEPEKRRIQSILSQIQFITHQGGHELDPETLNTVV